MEFNQSTLGTLKYWIKERERIRAAKERGAPRRTWTEDPILAKFHFCNVHRQDDRGTKEIQAVVKDFDFHVEDLPLVYTIARMLNSAQSLRVFLTGGLEGLKNYRDAGNKIFHVAYVVSTCGKSMDKIDYVDYVSKNVGASFRGFYRSDLTCVEVYKKLLKVDGLGTFLAAQVVADLKNDRYLVNATDKHSFAAIGPGSKKGMDYLLIPGKRPTNDRNFLEYLGWLRHSLNRDPVIKAMEIDNQDLQNCLCEFSKYMGHLLHEKRRNRYYE